MSEKKRFELTAFDTLYITDRINHKDYALNEFQKDGQKLVDLLNEQDCEIDNLKTTINILHESNFNDELKYLSKLDKCGKKIAELKKEINDLKEENMQLKKELKEIKNSQ